MISNRCATLVLFLLAYAAPGDAQQSFTRPISENVMIGEIKIAHQNTERHLAFAIREGTAISIGLADQPKKPIVMIFPQISGEGISWGSTVEIDGKTTMKEALDFGEMGEPATIIIHDYKITALTRDVIYRQTQGEPRDLEACCLTCSLYEICADEIDSSCGRCAGVNGSYLDS